MSIATETTHEQFKASHTCKPKKRAATDPANSGLAGDNSIETNKDKVDLVEQAEDIQHKSLGGPPARTEPCTAAATIPCVAGWCITMLSF